MGFADFFKRSQSAPITFNEAIVALGLPANTILRESDKVAHMWCKRTDLPSNGEANCYRVELHNLGNSVAITLDGKAIARLDNQCLPDAVDVFKAHGGKMAPAILQLAREGRRTDKVLATK